MILTLGVLCFVLAFPVALSLATACAAILLIWGHLLIRSEFRSLNRIENPLLEFNISISGLFLVAMVAEVF